MSRSTTLELIRSEELESVTLGRSRRVTAASVEAFVERLRSQAAGQGAAP
jgi:excisionase family DNA binding protein